MAIRFASSPRSPLRKRSSRKVSTSSNPPFWGINEALCPGRATELPSPFVLWPVSFRRTLHASPSVSVRHGIGPGGGRLSGLGPSGEAEPPSLSGRRARLYGHL